MKVLGWMLLLATTSLHAQAVIDSVPLSVQDDGTRQISTGPKDGSLVLPEKGKEPVVKVEAVDVKPESLEEVNATTKKQTKAEAKKTKKKGGKIATNKATEEAARAAQGNGLPTEVLKKNQPKVEDKSEPIGPAPVAVVVTPTPPSNPIDGQLKLDGPSAPAVPSKVSAKVTPGPVPVPLPPVKVEEKNDTVIAVAVYENPLKKYIQLSMGYLGSSYDKIDSSLDNGSILSSFRFAADFTQNWQSGFAMEVISDKSNDKVPDNIRVLQYRLFADYHAPINGSQRFDWIAGMAFSMGDYGIKKRYINGLGQEVSLKIKDGTIFGLIPSAGVRIYLVGRSSFDLEVEYHQYLGSAQSHIGGLAFSPRLSFEF